MRALRLEKMPSLRGDAAAERFVATADLTEYDLARFKPMRFEIEPKAAALNMRLPRSLLEAVKAKARASGMPYTHYVRIVLENAVTCAERHRFGAMHPGGLAKFEAHS